MIEENSAKAELPRKKIAKGCHFFASIGGTTL